MMLTKKQNLLETIRGGHPDRYVNQFEFWGYPYRQPMGMLHKPVTPGGEPSVDGWGITWQWPAGTPGSFPDHSAGKKVLTDITQWEKQVHCPDLSLITDELWRHADEFNSRYDREEYLVGPMLFPGVFEMMHSLMGMDDALIAFYTEPEAVHDLIEYIVDYEMRYIKMQAENLHPNVVVHHDDWGSATSTFMSPDMFEEFFLFSYKRLYRMYRVNGFEVIIHHSDSYAATLVPYMIEMGIDIWQGATWNNDIPAILEKYGGQLTIMGGIDNSRVDREDWTEESVMAAVREVCLACGTKYFIPCLTAGAPFAAYPGVYDAVSAAISEMSREMFPDNK